MIKVTKGMKFVDSGTVFEVSHKKEDSDLWFCKNPTVRGDWGYEEEYILNNLVEEESKKNKAA